MSGVIVVLLAVIAASLVGLCVEVFRAPLIDEQPVVESLQEHAARALAIIDEADQTPGADRVLLAAAEAAFRGGDPR